MGIRPLTASHRKGKSWAIIGGAGFIGSHFVDRLLADPNTGGVTVFDNFSSGQRWHLDGHSDDSRLEIVEGDAKDQSALVNTIEGRDTVIHLAANPDIARAATQPAIDFDEGTVLAQNVLEAIRRTGCGNLLYASGSGVYGDRGDARVREGDGPMEPISTYGASKLACEALISAYCHMFGLRACAFRFGNVVGPRQTHGVGYDFIRKLKADPRRLDILGDGSQSKPYIHVNEIIEAVLLADNRSGTGFNVFNVAPDDAVTVSEIAELSVTAMGLARGAVELHYGSDSRGWKGDVPIVRLDCSRIGALGWSPRWNSREAVERSLSPLIEEMERRET